MKRVDQHTGKPKGRVDQHTGKPNRCVDQHTEKPKARSTNTPKCPMDGSTKPFGSNRDRSTNTCKGSGRILECSQNKKTKAMRGDGRQCSRKAGHNLAKALED